MNKLIVGAFIGFIACFFVLTMVRPFGFMTRAEVSKAVTTQTPTSFATVTPNDSWQKIVNDSSLSTVAIQAFDNKKLKKQGSGVILSSDGLIVTTSDLSNANTIQVLYEDKILRASTVKTDVSRNLTLLKIDGSNYNVSSLDIPDTYESGEDLVLTGKLADLSALVIFSQKALVSYVLDRKVILDTQISDIVNGAKVLDSSGLMVGIVNIREGKANLISSKIISEF